MSLHTGMFEDGTAYDVMVGVCREEVKVSYTLVKQPWDNWNKVALICSDVDGVLTDGAMYWTEDGKAMKKFHTRDASAVPRLQKAGIKVAFITSADCPITDSRLVVMNPDFVWKICEDKWRAIQELAGSYELEIEEIAFIGDDDMDKEALNKIGSPFVPKDGLYGLPGYRCRLRGGEGVLGEVAQMILNTRNAV